MATRNLNAVQEYEHHFTLEDCEYLEHEHEVIRDTLYSLRLRIGQLLNLSDEERFFFLDEIERLLTFLGRRLKNHFGKEEAGILGEISMLGPTLHKQVHALFVEHREMSLSVDELVGRLRKGRKEKFWNVPELKRDIECICDQIVKHEIEEQEIITDFLYSDLGGEA